MSLTDKLKTIAENQQQVYEAGQTVGAQKAYDEFWDAYQQNGERTAYEYAFFRFSASLFYPKYDIKPTNMTSFMQYFNLNNETIDLAEKLNECGVVLDTSKATNMNSAFYWRLGVTRLPAISFIGVTNSSGFSYAISANTELITIDKLIFSDDGTQPFTSTVLYNNPKLENITTIEGVIGKEINVTACIALSHDSLMNIINHLKDYSEDTSGTTHKLTLGTTNLKKLTDEEKAQATQKGWTLA